MMATSSLWAILVDGNPFPVDAATWAEWFHTHEEERRIGRTRIKNHLISTVFMGLDHNALHGKPHYFESALMVDGEFDRVLERYATMEEARLGHEDLVDHYRKELEMQ